MHQFFSSKDEGGGNYEVTMIISDKDRFERADQGGAIYILPAQGFNFDKNKGLGIYEYTSKKAVEPILKINFSSALEAMRQAGVHVYFLSSEQFQHYLSLSHGDQEKFLSGLKQ